MNDDNKWSLLSGYFMDNTRQFLIQPKIFQPAKLKPSNFALNQLIIVIFAVVSDKECLCRHYKYLTL